MGWKLRKKINLGRGHNIPYWWCVGYTFPLAFKLKGEIGKHAKKRYTIAHEFDGIRVRRSIDFGRPKDQTFIFWAGEIHDRESHVSGVGH